MTEKKFKGRGRLLSVSTAPVSDGNVPLVVQEGSVSEPPLIFYADEAFLQHVAASLVFICR